MYYFHLNLEYAQSKYLSLKLICGGGGITQKKKKKNHGFPFCKICLFTSIVIILSLWQVLKECYLIF